MRNSARVSSITAMFQKQCSTEVFKLWSVNQEGSVKDVAGVCKGLLKILIKTT